ncbi:MAG: hypothetical protein AOA65_1599 [Candidatus Bathyarchaeota archaeon BA1]|nr:MAG: hypothetical protein AOA65_1599 [Candidatus Bathyarchaeota archaeon BA1]
MFFASTLELIGAHAWFKILFCEVCLKFFVVAVDFESLEVLFDSLNLGSIKDVLMGASA